MKSIASLFVIYCLIASGLARSTVFLGYQDSLGQYSFGYSAPGSARSEVRTSNGATRGTYSYVDETGVIQTAQYVADGENGFRVIATNLPQAPLPVQDTPEVMAARTAHLQALELASRRDEETDYHDGHIQNTQRNQGDVNIVAKLQNQSEIKSIQNLGKQEEQLQGKVQKSDESLEAIASKSDADKENHISAEIHEESDGRTAQEIIDITNIPEIPLISPHVLSPQLLGQNTVPVFRISHGNHVIEPSAIPESSIVQGGSGVITPAGTALKNDVVQTKEISISRKEQVQHANQQVQITNTVPVNIIPLSYSHSNFIRYTSPTSLHYVTYSVL